MLEYSDWAYYVSLCFTPGAINRWRAHEHLAQAQRLGLQIICAEPTRRDILPIDRARLARKYRVLPDDELRTVAIDIIARYNTPSFAVAGSQNR